MINSSNIATLITALRTEDRRTHTLVVEDLIKMGAAAVEPLLAVLRDSNPNVRAGAARALGKIGDQRALSALIFCLRYDTNADVRKSAVWALHLGDERAVSPLVDALGDIDEWVRFGAVIVLAKIGAPAVKALSASLQHENSWVRMSAAETLGRIGDRRAADALAMLLSDPQPNVRHQTAVSLGRMSDARAVDTLIEVLNNPTSELRTKAIKALGQIGDVRAVDPLVEIVYQQHDRWMRLFALEALGHIGDFRTIEVMLDAAYDDSQDIRTKAIITLGEIPYTFALDALFSLATDSELETDDQQNALFELGKRGDLRACVGLLHILQHDPRSDTRTYAALVLGHLQTPAVIEPMVDALCDDIPDVAAHVMKSLVKLGDLAVEELSTSLENMSVFALERRLWVVRALGEIGTDRAVATLFVILRDADEPAPVRDAARMLLSGLGYTGVI